MTKEGIPIFTRVLRKFAVAAVSQMCKREKEQQEHIEKIHHVTLGIKATSVSVHEDYLCVDLLNTLWPEQMARPDSLGKEKAWPKVQRSKGERVRHVFLGWLSLNFRYPYTNLIAHCAPDLQY